MHTAPLAERIDFVRYKTAELHLAHAGAALQLAERVDEFKNVAFFREIVWTAFYVNYAKPFRQARDKSKGFGLRLPDDIIPPEHRDTHFHIITMRDKHFAHSDLDFPTNPFVSKPEELLTVFATEAGFMYGIVSIIPAKSTVADFHALLDAVTEKLLYRSRKIMNRWARHLRIPPNTTWTVNLSSTSDEILTRFVTTTAAPKAD